MATGARPLYSSAIPTLQPGTILPTSNRHFSVPTQMQCTSAPLLAWGTSVTASHKLTPSSPEVSLPNSNNGGKTPRERDESDRINSTCTQTHTSANHVRLKNEYTKKLAPQPYVALQMWHNRCKPGDMYISVICDGRHIRPPALWRFSLLFCPRASDQQVSISYRDPPPFVTRSKREEERVD